MQGLFYECMNARLRFMDILPFPSPNYDGRPEGAAIDTIVIHYTDMETPEAALHRMCDPEVGVSAHYLIDEAGIVYQLVPEEKRAWHAGESHWRGVSGVNAVSVGIELANPGHEHGYPDFPAAQMDAVLKLCRGIKERHGVADRNVVAHSDIAFLRKCDPGEKFDWAWMAREGVGIYPFGAKPVTGTALKKGDTGQKVMRLQQALCNWGYGLKTDGKFAEKTEACVIAFQRHYRPEGVTGAWDEECAGRLALLLAGI
jgi:N-acetylmuramoyl-L-alanine amidase